MNNPDQIVWNYIYRTLNEKFWKGKLRSIPTFCRSLSGDQLGDFEHTVDGFNLIILADNQQLSVRELCGVLLHEMCHQAVFEKFGCDLHPHGKEWQEEMRRVGFSGKIDMLTDGLDRFSKDDTTQLIIRHNYFIKEYGISD